MKLEEFGYALADASHAIKLDLNYAKAYYRRATCYLQILKPQSAISDFKKVLALEPKNEIVRGQMTATQKLIRKIEFEKAIEVEGEKNPVERCHEIIAEGGPITTICRSILTKSIGACDLESSYSGLS
ncbi:hypothetical protein BDZ89DRAFT_939934 [Hymenopellis radicata]|nr:hypothetical protein BDZ89DRAFT_939934 [Hymenopellis radicata]